MQRCVCLLAAAAPRRAANLFDCASVQLGGCDGNRHASAAHAQSQSQAELRVEPQVVPLADWACCSPRCFRAGLFCTTIENVSSCANITPVSAEIMLEHRATPRRSCVPPGELCYDRPRQPAHSFASIASANPRLLPTVHPDPGGEPKPIPARGTAIPVTFPADPECPLESGPTAVAKRLLRAEIASSRARTCFAILLQVRCRQPDRKKPWSGFRPGRPLCTHGC